MSMLSTFTFAAHYTWWYVIALLHRLIAFMSSDFFASVEMFVILNAQPTALKLRDNVFSVTGPFSLASLMCASNAVEQYTDTSASAMGTASSL